MLVCVREAKVFQVTNDFGGGVGGSWVFLFFFVCVQLDILNGPDFLKISANPLKIKLL